MRGLKKKKKKKHPPLIKGGPFVGGGGGKHCNLERGVFTLHNTATDFGRELSPENFEMVVFVG